MRQAISTEDYQALLERYKTAKITAQSFAGGHQWLNQMNQAYENMDWQWLDNLCTGVNQALQEHTEKSRKSSRELPHRELTPQERLDLHRRKK